MGLFDIVKSLINTGNNPTIKGMINYGRTRNDGGHDHRTHIGKDRTPAQKEADKKKRK